MKKTKQLVEYFEIQINKYINVQKTLIKKNKQILQKHNK